MKKYILLLAGAMLVVFSLFVTSAWTEAVDEDDAAVAVYGSLEEKLAQNLSISFTKADLKGVLSLLARTYDLNILVGEEIKGSVNISLKDVTLEKALQSILELNDYSYTIEGGIIKVAEVEEEVVTELLNVNFMDLTLATEVLQKFLSEDASIKINDKTNQIIVTDSAAKIEKATTFLKKVDLPPRQIMIEAKLVDITHTDLDNLGITWAGTDLYLRMPEKWFGEHMKGQPHSELSTFTQTLAGTSSDLDGDQLVFGITRGNASLTATIDALVQKRMAKVLASPTITTINNVEARINIGEKYPIREQTQTTTGTLETTRFVDVGITLKVTPKITEDGYVQITIHPEVSSVSSDLDAGPRITTREADSTVILKDRQTVIMAGLIKEEETFYRTKIPILGYLPFIGNLFSSRHKTFELKELVILLTPYILPSGTNKPFVTRSYQQGVSIDLDANLIYNMATDLVKGTSLKSSKKTETARFYEAAMGYRKISDRFPLHELADDGLYDAAKLYYYELKDYANAREVLDALMTNYPYSEHIKKARAILKRLKSKRRFESKKVIQ